MLQDIKNDFTVVSSLPPKSRILVKRLTHGTVTGTWTVGETITGGTSKKTAVIDSVESATALVINTDGGLESGEVITGGTSSATATTTAAPAAYGHKGSSAGLAGYNSATVVFSTGAIGADTTATPTIEESTTGTTWTEVEAARLNGTLAAVSASSTLVIGVTDIGGVTKKFIRPVITIAGSNTVLCSAYVLRGEAVHNPAGGSSTILIG